MASLPIVQFPEPLLKLSTKPVERMDAELRQFIGAMVATMQEFPRCVGLAAPQVGRNLRVAVMDSTGHPKAQAGGSGLIVLVNPRIVASEGAKIQREGCLSVPDFTGNVRRAERICVRALDGDGQAYERWLSGFEAVIAQHEVDHLDGLLFLDRVSNLKTDVFRRKTYH